MRKTSSLPNSIPDSADYPYGGIQDETGDQAGTPVIEATYSDFIQNMWHFMGLAGVVPNGLADNVANGYQLYLAISKILCPVGTVRIWPSNTTPSQWYKCGGQSLLKSAFPDLYAVIGNTYGSTDTHFNLPDLRNRVPVCLGDNFNVMGATGGEITHLLTTGEIPAHYHNNGMADDEGSMFVYGATSAGMPGLAYKSIDGESTPRTYQGKTSSIGDGGAHNNMPPYITMSYIIRVYY